MTKPWYRVALITGATSGLGLQFAKIHAHAGGDLVLVARNPEKLKEIKYEIERESVVRVYIVAKDLTLPDAPNQIYDEIIQEQIPIEILINNAGFGGQGKFYERTWNEDADMIHLNVFALTALTRLFLSDFVSRGKGRILNISSVAALMPGPLQAVYFATKAYVKSFSLALTEELKGSGVSVTVLLPGPTATGFAERGGLQGTLLFIHSASAFQVAHVGYEAMIRRNKLCYAGVSLLQRFALALSPFVPLSLVLKIARKIQEIP